MSRLDVSTFISGDPKGQPRPRAYARKMGLRHVARVYDSDVADAWKAAVDQGIRRLVKSQGQLTLTESPVSLIVVFFFRRPKSHHSAKGALKPSAPTSHTQKPDIDNLVKLVADRITRSGRIWRDDSQIDSLVAIKNWGQASTVGCWVSIREAEGAA